MFFFFFLMFDLDRNLLSGKGRTSGNDLIQSILPLSVGKGKIDFLSPWVT